MSVFKQSQKLANVCYEIRGPALQEAYRLEEEGHRIAKLNIGNPAPFGFDAPEEIIRDVMKNIHEAQGYCNSKGLFSARKAIMQDRQLHGIDGTQLDDIYIGNGVSELIVMATQGLLNNGDEVLVPAPDYPLWTAAVNLSGGTAVHYHCNEDDDWNPDVNDIADKITPKTRGIVLINPNNPTGAVYSKDALQAIVDLAEKHQLIVFADEIYDRIIYDDAEFIPLASLVKNTICLSFNGLSKSYRLAGFRSGWMIVSGAKDLAPDFIEGLDTLASMRLCSNVPAQLAIQTALGGYQSINDLVMPSGRLHAQREAAYQALTRIPGVSCVKPNGAIYMFPKLDPSVHRIKDDAQLVLDLLRQEKILLVQGSGFNLDDQQHLRIVFLPRADELTEIITRVGRFLEQYTQ
ncbi:MAG: pyridoxal phosphate-dependent aminotransferase [Pseudomonadota bacterium]